MAYFKMVEGHADASAEREEEDMSHAAEEGGADAPGGGEANGPTKEKKSSKGGKGDKGA